MTEKRDLRYSVDEAGEGWESENRERQRDTLGGKAVQTLVGSVGTAAEQDAAPGTVGKIQGQGNRNRNRNRNRTSKTCQFNPALGSGLSGRRCRRETLGGLWAWGCHPG